ncbi:AlwI family type II restriction endonuclease [Defluviitalea phaphyphila]|uniref:AlwI family type II restriction endonuclease n=1 Tax=Defluviitalea phaphyphila TaxID=1473580 RepID=UPI0007312AAF|nr:AlwI family type II restriction endonuclease [Defluviitalea phaphyphila]
MPKCWSLSTTIRNPERNISFLKVLAEFEGKVFTEEIQAAFFKRLIQTKNYKPMGLPHNIKVKYEEPEEFTDEELEQILNLIQYENSQFDNQEQIYAFRGRTAVGNLNKMGMAIARESIGTVTITPLGREILSDSPNFENIFLRYFLKWQLPNPAESGYNGFNINPFIGTLHVINKVNELWSKEGYKPVGLNKEEFALFIPTLTNYKDIRKTAENIISFRKTVRTLDRNNAREYIDNCFRKTVIDIFGLDKRDEINIVKKINNLYDYGDSAIRYFRQTNLLYYRGKGRYIDLSPTRAVEIQKILKTYDGRAKHFKNIYTYLEYMADINQPILPWEDLESLKKIYAKLFDTAINLQNFIEQNYKGQSLHKFNLVKTKYKTSNEYNAQISELKTIIKILQTDYLILSERNLNNLPKYIEKLNDLATRRKAISGQDPLNLEYYVAQTLIALDDARKIMPNYLVADDNMPIFTASGDKADIECYYDDFNMISEVTLLKGRNQWYAEGQPVMRHLRDFEDKNPNKDNYCLFIAPLIHRDTLNTFWMGIKLGYEGKKQKIIPLTINQYNKILQIVIELNNNYNIRIKQKNIKDLIDELYNSSENFMDSREWIQTFDDIIETWGINLVSLKYDIIQKQTSEKIEKNDFSFQEFLKKQTNKKELENQREKILNSLKHDNKIDLDREKTRENLGFRDNNKFYEFKNVKKVKNISERIKSAKILAQIKNYKYSHIEKFCEKKLDKEER